jgi:two-component system CheB/CheR fusion protein
MIESPDAPGSTGTLAAPEAPAGARTAEAQEAPVGAQVPEPAPAAPQAPAAQEATAAAAKLLQALAPAQMPLLAAAGETPAAEEAIAAPAAEAPVKAEEVSARPGRVKFPIVGIGASAGGLEALEALTRRLFTDSMAYVIVQHLAPGHASVLTDILARGTAMNVVTIRDGMQVEPNTIYVTPPNVSVELHDGVLKVLPPYEGVPRHSIDAFFRSLAADQGPACIGVILSGAGSDGTLGLKAIKDEGGITFVQDPLSASQSSMPQSALDAGMADYCLRAAEIGDELMRLGTDPFVAVKCPRRLFDEDSLRKIFSRLHRSFGVDFSAYKRSTIERRIERRMALQKLDQVDDYLKFIESNTAELNVLYSDLLIGVSGFFRDREPFDALKTLVFPRLLEHRSPDIPIRVWVPGCSTGEEAYSIAMCLLEYLGDRASEHKIQIFATDIDDHALARARLAIYPASIDIDVSSDRIQRFFSQQEKGYQVSRQVRDLIVFARHNIGKDPPFSRLDLVSCRNVLIYMQPPLQRRVLRVFHYALNPDAFLLLGTSESVGDAPELFSLLDRKLKIYQKKNIPSTAVFDFSLPIRAEAEEPAGAGPLPPVPDHRMAISIQQLADRKLMERYSPPSVLLNENLEVMQFRGQTGPYFAPAPGIATFNIFKLVRAELLVELRAAIKRATDDNAAVSSSPIPLWDNQGVSIVLDVLPLQDASATRRCLVVCFREVFAPVQPAAEKPPAPPPLEPPRVAELERELLLTKEYLQSTVEELEAANEELQSSNEELQSANEELQSTNEELETSKEELQSTNEELATVNEELQNRMAQLAQSNDDLLNLLSSIRTAVIMVGMDLRIRRFTAAAEKLLSLIAADVGRPITYLSSVIKVPQIEQLVVDTINSVTVKELRVQCADGLWYTLRIQPYRTADHAIRGAILELTRASQARKSGERAEIHESVGKVLSTLPDAFLLLDDQLRIVWANKKFFDTFECGAEVLGASLEETWPEAGENPEFWALLEATVAGGLPFRDVMVSHPFGRMGDGPMRFSANRVPEEAERPALTVVRIEEVSGGAAGR